MKRPGGWRFNLTAAQLQDLINGQLVNPYTGRILDTDRLHEIKHTLLAYGLKKNKCERCGIEEWQGKPIGMDLHHKDSDRKNNRLDNLEFICPNCHRQETSPFNERRLEVIPTPEI